MPSGVSSSPRLAVAIVAPSLSILGGQAVQAQRLLQSWTNDAEISAFLVPINPAPPRWLRPLARIKYLRTILTELIYFPLLVQELRRADVVHVFAASYWSFLLAPLPAVIVARLLGRPVILNYRSGEAPDHLHRSRIARWTLRAVDRNVVPSSFLRHVFARYGIDATVIPNVVDRERFSFRVRDPLRPRIVSTRNFEPLYNLSCTLRAFGAVQRCFPDAALTLIGGGSQEPLLRQLADELDLRNVTFVGRVAPDEIWRYYAEADIYLQTPDIDNMPSSVLEAFASGCAVVSTNAGGVPAILTSDTHGLLVDRGDHNAAAASIIRLLEDPILTRRLTAAAQESCEQYHWQAVRAKWVGLYQAMIPRATASTAAESGTAPSSTRAV
jgi:glycosyltransferase involved in cell wall biosynthesis